LVWSALPPSSSSARDRCVCQSLWQKGGGGAPRGACAISQGHTRGDSAPEGPSTVVHTVDGGASAHKRPQRTSHPSAIAQRATSVTLHSLQLRVSLCVCQSPFTHSIQSSKSPPPTHAHICVRAVTETMCSLWPLPWGVRMIPHGLRPITTQWSVLHGSGQCSLLSAQCALHLHVGM
jgi:hypothetical protein